MHPWLWGLCIDAAAAVAPGPPAPPAFCRSKSSTCIDDGRLLAPRPRKRAGPLHTAASLRLQPLWGVHLQHVARRMRLFTTASAWHVAPLQTCLYAAQHAPGGCKNRRQIRARQVCSLDLHRRAASCLRCLFLLAYQYINELVAWHE